MTPSRLTARLALHFPGWRGREEGGQPAPRKPPKRPKGPNHPHDTSVGRAAAAGGHGDTAEAF